MDQQKLKECSEDSFKASYRAASHKKEMCTIVLNSSLDDSQKITKIRECILQYRIGISPKEKPSTQEKEKGELAFMNQLNMFSDLIQTQATPVEKDSFGIKIKKMEFVTDIIDIFTKPLKEHDLMIEKIANIIRMDNCGPENKIEAISNFLM